MKITLINRKKVVANFPRSALTRKNIVEKGGPSSLGMKKE
jgi:hypothetical protein